MLTIIPRWDRAFSGVCQGISENNYMEIGVDLYRSAADIRQGIEFDVGCIIMRLFQTFPGIAFEEEYFQKQLASVKLAMKGLPPNNADLIAIRDAEERG